MKLHMSYNTVQLGIFYKNKHDFKRRSFLYRFSVLEELKSRENRWVVKQKLPSVCFVRRYGKRSRGLIRGAIFRGFGPRFISRYVIPATPPP
jgi:hypothetical protein